MKQIATQIAAPSKVFHYARLQQGGGFIIKRSACSWFLSGPADAYYIVRALKYSSCVQEKVSNKETRNSSRSSSLDLHTGEDCGYASYCTPVHFSVRLLVAVIVCQWHHGAPSRKVRNWRQSSYIMTLDAGCSNISRTDCINHDFLTFGNLCKRKQILSTYLTSTKDQESIRYTECS